MRAVIQRVLKASVTIEATTVAEIGPGLLILLGIEHRDGQDDIAWLSRKVANLRILADSEGKMNQSIVDTGGQILLVSQFTLHGSTQKGNRPSFLRAAIPAVSEPLYQEFCAALERELAKPISRGVFGADMQVALINDGPVTILIDSQIRE